MLQQLILVHVLVASVVVAATPVAQATPAPSSTGSTHGPRHIPGLFQQQPSSPRQPPSQLHNLLHTIQAGSMDLEAAVRLLDGAKDLHQQQQQQHPVVPPGDATQPAAHASVSNSNSTQQQGNKGILITAGNLQLVNAYITLALLYSYHNCTLPAEVVYYGQQELLQPAAAAIRALAEATAADIRLVDGSVLLSKQLQVTAAARQTRDPPHPSQHSQQQQQQQQQGKAQHPPTGNPDVLLGPHPLPPVTSFLTKVHALVYVTRLRHVLLLDSDNMPLSDPSYILTHPEYVAAGNLFWSDFWTNKWMDPACYQLLGLGVPWEEEPGFRATESGQVALDRHRHADALQWLWLLNIHKDVTWKCFYGDKDTYRMAFQLAGKAGQYRQLALQPHLALGQLPGDPYHHAGMMQPGPDGQLLFFHRTAAGKFWPQCAMRDGQGCTVNALTMPVDQVQLLASVVDPTNMTLAADKVDKHWQEQHCWNSSYPQPASQAGAASEGTSPGAAAAGAGGCAAGSDSKDLPSATQHCTSTSSSSSSSTPLGPLHLPCNASASVGLQPIPVVEASRLPPALLAVLERSQQLFLATPGLMLRHSRAGNGVPAGVGDARTRVRPHDEL